MNEAAACLCEERRVPAERHRGDARAPRARGETRVEAGGDNVAKGHLDPAPVPASRGCVPQAARSATTVTSGACCR